MREFILIFFLISINCHLGAQLSETFDDGDFTSNPLWVGDDADFIVNDNLELQLNALDVGQSNIFTQINLSDSIRWSSSVRLEFSPSGSNQLQIFLAADTPNAMAENALYFEIGESGSEDAIQFYERKNGIDVLLMSASEGSVGAEPANFTFTLEKTVSNQWTLAVIYGDSTPVVEWSIQHDSDVLALAEFYGFNCAYTSTRTDKFFFDNIKVEDLLPDMEAPTAQAELLTANTIQVQFSEFMDIVSLMDMENYDLLPDIGLPSQIIINENNTSQAELVFPQNMVVDREYILMINGVMDEAGNTIIENEFEFLTSAPTAESAIVIGDNQIEICFAQSMDDASVGNPLNYTLSPSNANPIQVRITDANSSKIILEFANDFEPGNTLDLVIKDVQDLRGFGLNETTLPILVLSDAEELDLIVNEILFNPEGTGFDYIEIYNQSDKSIDLANIWLDNNQNSSDPIPIQTDRILGPAEYAVICSNLIWLAENYTILDNDALIQSPIPTLNNASGNVTIGLLSSGLVIDQTDYDEDYHSALLNDVDGVSLERLKFTGDSNDPENWTSASTTAGYGTPGYQNSQQVTGGLPSTGEVSLENKTFSPNGDGDGDQLIINYNLEKPGFSGTIKIYNDRGLFVRELVDNILLSQEGFITWDGRKSDFQNASVGIYIIAYRFFHIDGDVISGKKACVLADFLD